ncbi:MAG: metalloregulator ArsR/SmtB family transcription factor [Planctomycetes bacterium]|nr:metalloregulator ArsR/SmtB family transcription factor [Planctomycetota bacterium]
MPKSAADPRCAETLKVLADATRLAVLRQLMRGPQHVGEINARLGLEQSLLSHHLRVLREAGLVIAERDGKAVLYSLAPGVDGSRAENALDLGCCRLSFEQSRGMDRAMGRSILRRVTALALLFVAAASCTRADSAAGASATKLIITGSGTIAPLLNDIARRFEARNPGTRIDVQSGGSSRGMTDVRGGQADIGMVSRALGAKESDLVAHTVASDGICMIAHRDNAIPGLTKAEVVALYTNRAEDWKEVGGSGGAVTVVNKADGRSTLDVFLHYFELKSTDVAADVVIGDNEQGIKTVAANRRAIGYVSIGSAEYGIRRGEEIRILPVDGVETSIAAVRAGTFPMMRPLNLVTAGPPSGLARRFIDFAKSKEVDDLIEQHCFVPIAH